MTLKINSRRFSKINTLTIKITSSILNKSASSVREEVELMVYIISFVSSVMASVVGYYICKWLDR